MKNGITEDILHILKNSPNLRTFRLTCARKEKKHMNFNVRFVRIPLSAWQRFSSLEELSLSGYVNTDTDIRQIAKNPMAWKSLKSLELENAYIAERFLGLFAPQLSEVRSFKLSAHQNSRQPPPERERNCNSIKYFLGGALLECLELSGFRGNFDFQETLRHGPALKRLRLHLSTTFWSDAQSVGFPKRFPRSLYALYPNLEYIGLDLKIDLQNMV